MQRDRGEFAVAVPSIDNVHSGVNHVPWRSIRSMMPQDLPNDKQSDRQIDSLNSLLSLLCVLTPCSSRDCRTPSEWVN
jgi:hypothetical protein